MGKGRRERIGIVQPAFTTLRDQICKVAVANSSGTCTRDYLDPTHYSGKEAITFPPEIDWCAFYAAWVWRQAGAGVYFRTYPKPAPPAGICRESTDRQVAASSKLKFLASGDIIVFSPRQTPTNDKPRNHHAIIIATYGNGTIDVVEGNYGTETWAPPPETSPVHYTRGFDLLHNKEEKVFYSVDTFQDPKVRFM
jgi:hypothetical protein